MSRGLSDAERGALSELGGLARLAPGPEAGEKKPKGRRVGSYRLGDELVAWIAAQAAAAGYVDEDGRPETSKYMRWLVSRAAVEIEAGRWTAPPP